MFNEWGDYSNEPTAQHCSLGTGHHEQAASTSQAMGAGRDSSPTQPQECKIILQTPDRILDWEGGVHRSRDQTKGRQKWLLEKWLCCKSLDFQFVTTCQGWSLFASNNETQSLAEYSSESIVGGHRLFLSVHTKIGHAASRQASPSES